jgi:hypothetical protein
MSDDFVSRARYGEAFWRAHHEAWQQSALNQREYCAAQGIPLKAFGNWRARFKAKSQLPVRKLLYRRAGLSHRLSHGLSHMTYGSAAPGPIVPPPREGSRRKFNEADKRRIVEEAVRPGASLSEVARHYGIAARVLFRWKQELMQASPLFVTVEIADATLPTEEHAS